MGWNRPYSKVGNLVSESRDAMVVHCLDNKRVHALWQVRQLVPHGSLQYSVLGWNNLARLVDRDWDDGDGAVEHARCVVGIDSCDRVGLIVGVTQTKQVQHRHLIVHRACAPDREYGEEGEDNVWPS